MAAVILGTGQQAVKQYEIIDNPITGIYKVRELMPFMNLRFGVEHQQQVVADYPDRFLKHARHPRDQRLHFGFVVEGKYNGNLSGVAIGTLEELRLRGEIVPWVCIDKVVSYPPNNGIMTDLISLGTRRKIRGERILYYGLRTGGEKSGVHEAYKTVSYVNNEEWKLPDEYFCHGFGLNPMSELEMAIFAVMCKQLQERPKTIVSR